MSEREYVSIRNWRRYQHYTDRNPPWVKLHVDLLDDDEFNDLVAPSRLVGVLLLLLAAKRDNKIPLSMGWLSAETDLPARVLRRGIADLRSISFLVAFDPAEQIVSGEPGSVSGKWASRYVSDELRTEIMARDGAQCVGCGTTERLEIDHVKPISKGGTSEADNLQVLCRSCNRAKRARSNSGASAEQNARQESSPRVRPTEAEAEAETEKALLQRQKRTEIRGNGLPVEKERLVLNLIAAIRRPLEEEEADSLRKYAHALPESALVKAIESVKRKNAADPLKYAFGVLISEKRELAERSVV